MHLFTISISREWRWFPGKELPDFYTFSRRDSVSLKKWCKWKCAIFTNKIHWIWFVFVPVIVQMENRF